MQTAIQLICKKGESLRETIVKDPKLHQAGLRVKKQKNPGRNPGWAGIASRETKIPGAMKITWDSDAQILSVRVVTKAGKRPSAVVGAFTSYLLESHGRRVRAIHILSL